MAQGSPWLEVGAEVEKNSPVMYWYHGTSPKKVFLQPATAACSKTGLGGPFADAWAGWTARLMVPMTSANNGTMSTAVFKFVRPGNVRFRIMVLQLVKEASGYQELQEGKQEGIGYYGKHRLGDPPFGSRDFLRVATRCRVLDTAYDN